MCWAVKIFDRIFRMQTVLHPYELNLHAISYRSWLENVYYKMNRRVDVHLKNTSINSLCLNKKDGGQFGKWMRLTFLEIP